MDTAVPSSIDAVAAMLAEGGYFADRPLATVLFLALRPLGAQGANLVALLVTAIANTAANRRFTFGVRGRVRVVRHQFEGLLVFAIGLALTSGSLAVLHAVGEPSRAVELLVLVGANLLATVVRFVLLRGWVFNPRRAEKETS